MQQILVEMSTITERSLRFSICIKCIVVFFGSDTKARKLLKELLGSPRRVRFGIPPASKYDAYFGVRGGDWRPLLPRKRPFSLE